MVAYHMEMFFRPFSLLPRSQPRVLSTGETQAVTSRSLIFRTKTMTVSRQLALRCLWVMRTWKGYYRIPGADINIIAMQIDR
jgi:hypothetical protein